MPRNRRDLSCQRASPLPGGKARILEGVPVGILEVEGRDPAGVPVPVGQALGPARGVADAILPQPGIGAVHVGHDDGDVLEGAVVRTRVRRDRPPLGGEELDEIDLLGSEAHPGASQPQPEDALEALPGLPRDFVLPDFLERENAWRRSRPSGRGPRRRSSTESTAVASGWANAHAAPREDPERQDETARWRARLHSSARLQMLADPQGVGHDRQRRIDRRAGREEAAVHDVEVVEFVGLAVHVEGRGLRVAPEADRPVLMRDARERDALADEEVAGEDPHVAGVAVHGALALLAACTSGASRGASRARRRCSARTSGRCSRRGRGSRGSPDREDLRK